MNSIATSRVYRGTQEIRRDVISSGLGDHIWIAFLYLALLLCCLLAPCLKSSSIHAYGVGIQANTGNHSSETSVTIDYPEDGSIFPPEITAPTFIWRDSDPDVKRWRVEVYFSDGGDPVKTSTSGKSMPIGEIDPRCVSDTNKLPSLTESQAAAHTWTPDQPTWEAIKRHSREHPAVLRIAASSQDPVNSEATEAQIRFTTSKDPVGAPIFYRDVPLMPSAGQDGVVQPLASSSIYLINWRLRDISQKQSRILLQNMPTCANCHSFSLDGKTMGMDVDGPANDKGLYAVVPILPTTVIRNADIVAWNTDRTVGKSRVGFMSQISPDGRYVLTTFAGPQKDLGSSYYVKNFKDYRFLQVFYPTRGILMWYDRKTKLRHPLPGADEPSYVQTDGVWSPDGKYIVYARAEARDPFVEGQKPALYANDENETQIKYDLYKIPFNNGKGGTPEPINGASHNGMSNNFPKISPDGRWIVFVRCRNGQLMRPDSELYMVPAAGGLARRMRCNTSLMNSWHSFSPNGRWLVFSSKSRSPYTQMFLTHIDEEGKDSPPIYIEGSTAANRAVNIPEFVNVQPSKFREIEVQAADYYRVVDKASLLMEKGKNAEALVEWQRANALDPEDSRAQNGLGITYYMQGDFDKAATYLLKAVDTGSSSIGDLRAKSYLGLLYLEGKGTQRNFARAMTLFGEAADKGYAPAQYYLGSMYRAGKGTPRDPQMAAGLYRASAGQGFQEAELALGEVLRTGEGVKRDPAGAIEILQKAADHGSALAAEKIAEMYMTGDGIDRNVKEAAHWYRQAAESGSSIAALMVGMMYHSGQGLGQDDHEAFAWLRKAADQGNPQAEYYVGTMLNKGVVAPRDPLTASNWFRRAADQGVAQAQFVLGVMYLAGSDLQQNVPEAYYYLELAHSCSHDEENKSTILQALDEAEQQLSVAQKVEEQERAAQWQKNGQCE